MNKSNNPLDSIDSKVQSQNFLKIKKKSNRPVEKTKPLLQKMKNSMGTPKSITQLKRQNLYPK